MECLAGQVGLFFVVEGHILLYACPLKRAGHYGDFLNYPHSHDDVWRVKQSKAYGVEYDFYPRGRIVYNAAGNRYTIYHDRCCEREARYIGERYAPEKVEYALDEHYQCRRCNPAYCD